MLFRTQHHCKNKIWSYLQWFQQDRFLSPYNEKNQANNWNTTSKKAPSNTAAVRYWRVVFLRHSTMWTNYGFIINFLPAILAKHKHILLYSFSARASRSLQNLSFFFCSTFNMLNILKKRIFLLLFFRIFCRRFFQHPVRNFLHLFLDFTFVRHAVHSVLHLVLHVLPVRHRIIHIRWKICRFFCCLFCNVFGDYPKLRKHPTCLGIRRFEKISRRILVTSVVS